jgi:DNA-binding protein YbaB
VDFEGAFVEARRQLDSVRAGADAARGEGEAADGQVRVVAAGGQLERVELDPRTKRMPGEQLAGHLVAAGNAALAELRSRAPAAGDVSVDPAMLARTLQQVTDEGLRSLAAITQAIEDAKAQVSDRTGMTGDPRPYGLEQLVEETRQVVPAPPPERDDQDPLDEEPPDLAGAGEAADGRIRARVAAGGSIEALEIDPPALRLASAEVAQQVKVAINGALDDMRAKAHKHAGAAGTVDLQRLQQLREDSVRQMGAYAGALRDLIASVYR